MARSFTFSGVQKTVVATTAQTIVFPANEIDGAGVIMYTIAFTGGADIADIDRIRVLASGDLIVDVTPAFLRTFLEATTKTGETQATTATLIHIPLYLPDLPTRDQRDQCQFPVGAQPQVEIDLLNTVPVGTAMCGWAKTDQAPQFASRLYASTMNIAASQNNARANFADGAIVRGLIHNTVGVSRIRALISDREAYRLAGEDFLGTTTGDLTLMTRVLESPTTIVDPFFFPITLGIPAASGTSFIEVDTEAGWGGVANEIGVWSVTPLFTPTRGADAPTATRR